MLILIIIIFLASFLYEIIATDFFKDPLNLVMIGFLIYPLTIIGLLIFTYGLYINYKNDYKYELKEYDLSRYETKENFYPALESFIGRMDSALTCNDIEFVKTGSIRKSFYNVYNSYSISNESIILAIREGKTGITMTALILIGPKDPKTKAAIVKIKQIIDFELFKY